MDDELRSEIEDLRRAGLLRKLRRIDQIEGTTVTVEGRRLVSFGSNDYLGLANHPELAAAVEKARQWGTGSTGSRLTTGDLALHETLEDQIARFKHTASAIVFSSGYAANVGVLSALVDRGDIILSDSLNHASLIDGCRLSRAEVRVYDHVDLCHARRLLNDRSSFRRLIVVTDGVFSMDGDLAPLPELVHLCEEFDGWLMVDDAHGTGVYGRRGSGTIEYFGLEGAVQIQMGTLSKAVGCAGGFVAGSTPLIELLRNRVRSFVYSTAMPPGNSAAASRALEVISDEPELRTRLFENIALLRSGLAELDVSVPNGDSPIIPLVLGGSEAALSLSSFLEEAGFWIPAIRPPTVPRGTSRLRITVSSSHTKAEISALLDAIAVGVRSVGVLTRGTV